MIIIWIYTKISNLLLNMEFTLKYGIWEYYKVMSEQYFENYFLA